jgi:uncharacterized membrane protein YtjA (UPF0391 family)
MVGFPFWSIDGFCGVSGDCRGDFILVVFCWLILLLLLLLVICRRRSIRMAQIRIFLLVSLIFTQCRTDAFWDQEAKGWLLGVII